MSAAKSICESAPFQVSSHVIGRDKYLQTMEELNETGVETIYQMHSSSLALGTNSD